MEFLVLILLTLLNGFFALSEIAIVSARKIRIEQIAKSGHKNAQIVLKLLRNPETFLSAVQIGITLVGIISGAYGAATLSDDVQAWLGQVSFLKPYAEGLSFSLVIAGITYFSILIGELVPKTIAISNPERIALFVAPIIQVFTLMALPLVKLLAVSTHFIVRLLNLKVNTEEKISEEDLQHILKTAGKQGLLAKDLTELHQNLLYFSHQRARNIQTHRKELEWLDINAPLEEITTFVRGSIHSKFLIGDGSADNLVGVLAIKDFYEYLLNPEKSFREILKKPVYVSETMLASEIVVLFRKHQQSLGVVVDEFGAVEGIVTLHDILEAIVGDMPDFDETKEPDFIKRFGKSYLVNAGILIQVLNRNLQHELIKIKPDSYTTLAGFITFFLSRVPTTGERFIYNGYILEIVDMDGFKIDKVILKKIPKNKAKKMANKLK